jgi:hypothetical protein
MGVWGGAAITPSKGVEVAQESIKQPQLAGDGRICRHRLRAALRRVRFPFRMPSAPAPSRLRLIPIALAQAFGLGCGIAGVKVNSSLVPPEVLGVYGIFLTLAPIGMWVVHAGLLKFTVRHWAAAARPELLRVVARAWVRRLPWLAVAAALGAGGLAPLTSESNVLLGLCLFSAAALLAAAALAQAALQAEGAHWRDSVITIVHSLSRTFLPPALYAVTGGTLAALWGGFALHALLGALTGAWMLRSYFRRAAPASGPEPALGAAYGGPLFIALAAAGWALAGVNRWIVAGFFGPTEAGFFTLAGGAAMVIASALGAVFMQYFQPGIFALADAASGSRAALVRRVDQVALAYTLTGLVAVATLAAAGPWLVGPLIAPAYRAALPWMLPAGCYGVALITLQFYQTLLLASRRERACGPVELTTAAVLVAGCVLSAAGGATWFTRWLVVTPLVPWLVARPLALRKLKGES